ncbi:MAG: TolC family protein [Candidatus Omnitrophica bacterium]|nr:TolC family protein [Candidatus Omnitrophota bacterium]MCM8826851.1 TolC family protein [Candidatus Omnitrophota bacterium]
MIIVKNLILFIFVSFLIPAFAETVIKDIDKDIFISNSLQGKVLKLSLTDCIVYALKNNSEVLIKKIEPNLRELDIKIAKGRFDPVITGEAFLTEVKEKPTSSFSYSELESREFAFGLKGRLITGTDYSLELRNKRTKTDLALQNINPYYETTPTFTITQPLSKNSGILVNTADIVIARNSKIQSYESFKDTVMDIVSKTKVCFYSYMFHLQSYAIAESSLARAKDLLDIVRQRYSKGLVSEVDLLEIETVVVEREKLLISAEAQLKRAEDELKLITNFINDPQNWNAQIEIVESKLEFKEEPVSLLESLKSAFEFRPDYRIAKLNLDNRNIKVVTAKNSVLPMVDLVASLSFNGLGDSGYQSLEKIDKDYKSYGLGVRVTLPLDDIDRARLEQREKELEQALLSFKRLEQKIILEVRDRVRDIDIQKRKVKVAKLNWEKEDKNYSAQKERYIAGLVSTHDILDYQDRLFQAELDYTKSIIDYNIALINFDKSIGLTLVRNGIKLEEE